MVDKIRKEDIKLCEGKQAKVVLDNDYVLRGKIDKVCEDYIFFSTAEKSAIIKLNAVKEIVF